MESTQTQAQTHQGPHRLTRTPDGKLICQDCGWHPGPYRLYWPGRDYDFRLSSTSVSGLHSMVGSIAASLGCPWLEKPCPELKPHCRDCHVALDALDLEAKQLAGSVTS